MRHSKRKRPPRRRRRRSASWLRLHRVELVAGTLLAAVVGLWMSRSPPPPTDPTDLCAIYRERISWYRDSRRAAERWRVPEPLIMAILYQESSLRARARPPRRWYFGFIPGRRPSTAYGYAQVVDATWRQFEAEIGRRASRRRFADATEFVGWYVIELGAALRASPTDPERVYLAYHEGPGGYARGSHRSKPEVARSARQVASRTERFTTQLEGCRTNLDRLLLWRTVLRTLALVALTTGLAGLAWRWLRR